VEIPEEIKIQLKEGVCLPCCGNVVYCMSEDLPLTTEAEVDLEFDRIGNEVMIRHIIKDNPKNPLYIEYYANKDFIDNITKNLKVLIIFVNNSFNEKMKFEVKIVKEDAQILRREVGLGT
jgi:hypothetical protein